MNGYTIGCGDEASLSIGTLLGNRRGASLPGTLRESSGDGCLHRGLLGNVEGSPFTRNFKRWLKGSGKRASLSAGALLGEPRGGWAPFLGIQKGMGRRAQGMDLTLCGEFGRRLIYRGLKKVLEMGTFLHRGPVKNHGGSVTGNSEG